MVGKAGALHDVPNIGLDCKGIPGTNTQAYLAWPFIIDEATNLVL
jgi:hypothetical protein